MSSDEKGGLEPELSRKNVVGLFCGAAFCDVVFARVPGCDVVRLYDWEVRMLKLARLFFPEEGVVKKRWTSVWRTCVRWKLTLAWRCLLLTRGCTSTPGFLARMEAR